MTICLLVCQQDYANTITWNFMKKNIEDGPGRTQISLNFKNDLDQPLDTEKLSGL